MNFNPERGMADFPGQENSPDYPKPGLSDVPASVREESRQTVDPINSIFPASQPDQAIYTETANLNLAHLTEQKKAIEDTATNSRRTADAIEQITERQQNSEGKQQETNLELEVIRNKIEDL